jgi:hypothetical protein
MMKFISNAICVTEGVCPIVSTFQVQYVIGTPVSSTNKTDRHDITEILLKVELNTKIPLPLNR